MESVTEQDPDDHGATRELPRTVPWVVVSRGQQTTEAAAVDQPRRVFAKVAAAALVVLLFVGLGAVFAARTLAERQAVNDAANTADVLAEAAVQPALEDGITTGEPRAVQRLAGAMDQVLENSPLVRVKLWSPDGTILWSDEPRLIGRQFELDDEERAVFENPRTRASVSDLDEPENVFERGQGKLLEAYRPVWTPSGSTLLFETYSLYDDVDAHSADLWRGFAGVTVTSLLVLCALLVPLLWGLISRLRAAQRQREELLERAVEASVEERRRIAGTLHDGVVQELAATSFAVTGAAHRAGSLGDERLSADLGAAAGTLRDSIGGLRTLLVDIYPETLDSAGLLEVLRDLGATMRSRDIAVHLDLPETDPGLGTDGDRLVFRIVHECLQNVRRHADANNLWLTLREDENGVVVEIADDGVGFDPAEVLDRPHDGHFGVRVLADQASAAGAVLEVATAPAAGCRWKLTVPR